MSCTYNLIQLYAFVKLTQCLMLNLTVEKRMPHIKNLTIRKVNNTGITTYRSTYGVRFERQKKAYQGYG